MRDQTPAKIRGYVPGYSPPGSEAIPGEGDYRNFNTLSLITNPEDHPWRMNVKLFMTFRTTTGVLLYAECSGALIDPKHVITAGHCVYLHTAGPYTINDWAESVTVIPAYENGAMPYGSAQGVQLHSWTGWTNNEDFDYDNGIIDLDRPVGALTSWFGYGFNTSCSFFTGNTFNNPGYPAESPYDGEFMYYWFGTFDSCPLFTDQLQFNSRSYGGQSGSGAYYIDGPNRYIYAVLSNGTSTWTRDTKITSSRFTDIGAIMSEDTPSTYDLIPLTVEVSPGRSRPGISCLP